jgi:hypothetical protein
VNLSGRTRKLLHIGGVAAALLVVGVAAFRDFVFGDKLLIYKDIGSDSANYYYPYLLLFSDYIRTEGLPLWTFRIGLGQTMFPDIGAVLLFQPAAWFPRDWIGHLMVYQHLLLVLVAGVFFSRFLVLRGVGRAASILGALLFGFSAYMTMGSIWTVLAGEVVCVAYALFALEMALVRGRWIHLPFAVAIFPLLTSFHLYLCAVLLTAYTIARFAAEPTLGITTFARRSLQLGAIALLGAGLTAVVWMDSLVQVRNSPRGSGMASYAGDLSSAGVLRLEQPLHYFTYALRSFANDMTGAGNAYRGWSNYLEGPLPYCGLIALLLLPQFFTRGTWRQRLVGLAFIVAVAIGVTLPWVRNLFYLFQGDYYRAFSLFTVTGMIILSMAAFGRYVRDGALNVWVLAGTLLVLLAVLFLPLPAMQQLADTWLQRAAAGLLIGYAVLLLLGRILRRPYAFGVAAIVVAAAELVTFNYVTVARDASGVVTKEERWQRVGFNDHTHEALAAIREQEEAKFYRVSKPYSSSAAEHANLNDSFAFDYFGSTAYISFNNLHYIRFLVAIGAMPPNPEEADTRWNTGVNGRPVAGAFLGEKYQLLERANADQIYGFEPVGEFGDVLAFRNPFALPLGLFFEDALTETLFHQFTPATKEVLLFDFVVLEDDRYAAEFAERPLPTLDEMLTRLDRRLLPEMAADRRQRAATLESFTQNRIQASISSAAPGYLVFQIPFETGWRAFVNGERVQPVRVNFGLIGLRLPAGDHQVVLRYLPPALWIGGPVSVLALLILIVARWRWSRIEPLPRA